MEVKCLSVGSYATNCYLVINDDNTAFIIDPGAEGERILKKVQEDGLKVKSLILTHGHFDHIGAVDFLRNKLDIGVLIHRDDQEYLVEPQKNLSVYTGSTIVTGPAEEVLDERQIGDLVVIHTPGHTPGSICLYSPQERILFSGDTIFCQGVGRTDLPGSSHHSLISSIKEKLRLLPDDVTVFPGHGPVTTIKDFRDFFDSNWL